MVLELKSSRVFLGKKNHFRETFKKNKIEKCSKKNILKSCICRKVAVYLLTTLLVIAGGTSYKRVVFVKIYFVDFLRVFFWKLVNRN